ncbi:MAG: LysM peptidoglycan-binding domain-containing protein, partial [Methyloligellaceae bacterium]
MPPPATANRNSSARTIVVRPGDTLYGFARRHNVTIGELRSANGLGGNGIRVGQTLRIPESSFTRTPRPTASHSLVPPRSSFRP